VSEQQAESLSTAPRPRANMRKAVAIAALALAVLALALYAVFGTFWDKQGIFWGGVHDQDEYQQALARYQGHDVKPLAQVHRITLAADGTGTVSSEVHFGLTAGGRALVYNSTNDAYRGRLVFRDRGDRVIPTRFVPGKSQDIYVLRLPPDLKEGDVVVTRQSMPLPAVLVKREGAGWRYDFRHLYGPPIHYTQELTLPARAQVTKAEPPPAVTREVGGRTTLVYHRQLGNNELFRYRVRYRLGG